MPFRVGGAPFEVSVTEGNAQAEIPEFAVQVADLLRLYGLTLHEAEQHFPGLTEALDNALKEPA